MKCIYFAEELYSESVWMVSPLGIIFIDI